MWDPRFYFLPEVNNNYPPQTKTQTKIKPPPSPFPPTVAIGIDSGWIWVRLDIGLGWIWDVGRFEIGSGCFLKDSGPIWDRFGSGGFYFWDNETLFTPAFLLFRPGPNNYLYNYWFNVGLTPPPNSALFTPCVLLGNPPNNYSFNKIIFLNGGVINHSPGLCLLKVSH